MELKEKVAYIKGLMEGMEYDVSTKEGKLMAAVVLLCGEYLHVNDERVGKVTVIDVVFAAHQRAALVFQFRGECHG